ncbi:hypothetical protein ACH5RR_006994 [Cinchona calisaya]|uniref:AAA+ ATPase domain-containing protein n=1 Tax=Cinchona calisaya TaxID=153742 RepID=A0ABD3AQM6_9GENT
MGEIISTILGPLLEVVVDYVATPIKDQLSYLCCFNSNIQNLGAAVESLEPKRAGVQRQVDAATRNVESVLPDVQNWLQKADKIKTTNDRIIKARDDIQKRCFHGWCTNLKSRYSLSREAKKTARDSVELRDNGHFVSISIPAYPADLEPIPARSDEIEFQSRKAKEEEIMDALKNNNVNMIGICGMGGVGKTTMVKKIEKRVIEEKLFENVVRAVVTQQLNLKNIQQEIAEALGLELKQETLSIRAKILHTRLKDVNSRVLIILDDIWESLDLEEIGIPSPNNTFGCKIILTSRVHDACVQMEAEKILQLVELPENEAWRLFREHAGDTVDAPNLRQIAENVAKECKGLPLALVTVGRALRNKSRTFWEDALLQLQQSMPENIPQVLNRVYRPLMLSYNQLANEETRYLFRLCCLFPEDHDISLDDLVGYGMGLQIFFGIRTLRDARNRVRALVETLRHRFLVENGKDAEHVKLHDIIRDMAIIIASNKDKHVFMKSHEIELEEWLNRDSCNEISPTSSRTSAIVALGERIDFENLQTLRLQIDVQSEGQMDIPIPNDFFDGMRGLKVIHIEGIGGSLRLPLSLLLLTNLRTLHLHSCDCTEQIYLIGKLVNLEILSLRCSLIEVVPKEIGDLKRLKLLDLTGCNKLKEIAPGVIAGLVGLEELLMLGSFKNWEAEVEGKERRNASLLEVASLKNLTTLEIEILDQEVLPPDDACQWQDFRRYDITVGMSDHYDSRSLSGNYDKVLKLNLYKPIPLSNWIHVLIRQTEYLDLYIRKSGACSNVLKLVQDGFQNLRRLELEDFDKVEDWENVFQVRSSVGVVFGALEELHLLNCRDLKVIFHGPTLAGSFVALKLLRLDNLLKLTHLWNQKLFLPNLTKVVIKDCSSLEYVLLLSAGESLMQIQELEIKNCPVLEVVFKEGIGGVITKKDEAQATVKETLLPQLKNLLLAKLPNFQHFCATKNDIELPSLESLTIKDCPKMEKFSRGSISLPSLEFVAGLSNPNLATQMFFNKEKLGDEIHLKSNSFILSARDLSIIWGDDTTYWEWGLAKYSSDIFVVGAKLLQVWWLAVSGRFEIVKLSPQTLYEVVFEIKLEKFTFMCETPVNLKLITPPEGMTQEHIENLDLKPRGEWIEILAGEFTTGPDPIGYLEFSLFQHDTKIEKRGLLVKGVTIRPKS